MAIIWVGTGRFGAALDPDAAAYITAVDTADGEELETAVRDAINAFVIGCKADGIWPAIKACCIMAGARTLAGALVPLVGPAPTNFNFVAGDYNRKTGIIGNGGGKYLLSNRNNDADPQDSKHIAIHITSADTRTTNRRDLISFDDGVGRSAIFYSNSSPRGLIADIHPSVLSTTQMGNATGFAGASRGSSANFVQRHAGVSSTITSTSTDPSSGIIRVFRRESETSGTDARLAYYSIGESLDLALLDARITTLINTFGAAIP
jgi:hypothetical protein